MKGTILVIGPDYGTTYTSVSFCETAGGTNIKDERIEIVHDWPSQHTKIATKEKVPSEITYHPTELWGAMIPADIPRDLWTKLELENRSIGDSNKIHQDTSELALNEHRSPVDIIGDFLSHVRGRLIDVLDRKYGTELWRTLPIKIVVTFPAVWSDVAKTRTRQAVEKAGFNASHFPKLDNIIDATEPESAAIYTIATLRNTVHNTQFEKNDGFILCDMGGGTVDLISYNVAELDPTVVEEVTIGSGDQCGGTFVDRAFLQWLERRLGTEDFIKITGCRSEQIAHTMLSKKAAGMLQNFTMEIKGGFSGDENYTLQLPSPLSAIENDPERGIEDGEIKITAEDLVYMFEKPVRRTYELLIKQFKDARQSKKVRMKWVFLLGGFSESAYMYRKIKEWAAGNDLQAFRPTYAYTHMWSAAARGAVAKGLAGDSRVVAKRLQRARGQMDWLLKMGQDLPTSGPAHVKIHRSTNFWPCDKRSHEFRLEGSNGTRAPKRAHGTNVFRVATAVADLSLVPEKEMEVRYSPSGQMYHHLKFTYELSVQSSIEMYLTVRGKRYGRLTASFE